MSDPLEGDSSDKAVPGIKGTNAAAGDGVFGVSETGTGVHGEKRSGGAIASFGFIGGTDPVFGQNTGIYGESSQQGVLGHSDVGIGVLGHSNSGIAVRGESSTGLAGKFAGNVEVDAKLTAAAVAAGEMLSGKLKAPAAGGLQLTAPNAADSITLMRENGANLSAVEMRADSVVCKDATGRPVVQVGAGAASIAIGAQGVAGHLSVNNANAQPTVSADGNTGTLNAAVVNAGAVNMAKLASPTNILDVNALALRIHGSDFVLDGRSGGNKRAIVDVGNKLVVNFGNDYAQGVQINGVVMDGTGTPLMGNPARKVTWAWLLCGSAGSTTVQDVDLGSRRQFVAFVSYVMIDPLNTFARADALAAEVYQVDGATTFAWINGGDHFGASGADTNVHAPAVMGVGRVIRFRARAIGPDCSFAILGVVFYE
jgi:hypothetical protein